MPDILTATSQHDTVGSITTFSPASSAGRAWMIANGGDEQGVYIVESRYAWMMLACIQDASLSIEEA